MNSYRDEPSHEECICQVCGNDTDTCTCPECPHCFEVGNPSCYTNHHFNLYDEIVENCEWLESDKHGCSRYATDDEESIWVCDCCEVVDIDPYEHECEGWDE